jgi:aerotaxis receptor
MEIIQNELILDDKSFLVSETDEKGIIKFANDDFCRYAEYELDELVGNPHNIVRHPDMPKAAFADLWNTVKKGQRWRGFVKNKTKSGKFYWVFATVFPYSSSDGSKGYISCRRKASRKEIEKYEKLYTQMKEEE